MLGDADSLALDQIREAEAEQPILETPAKRGRKRKIIEEPPVSGFFFNEIKKLI